MATKKGTRRVCSEGHVYFKSSDCPVCPKCRDNDNKKFSDSDLPEKLSSPALNALLQAGIINLKKLSEHSEKEVLSLHGIGKASIPLLTKELEEKGLKFKAI